MLSEIAALPPAAHTILALILGLLVGSFLNVVIFRLPVQLNYLWTSQSHEWLNKEPYTVAPPAGIIRPRSHCGHCKNPIGALQNIPIVSYLFLGGKCANCKNAISWRYPLVELLCGILTAFVVMHFGWSMQSLAGMLLTWILLCLSFIDYDHKLLPDDIVLPTLWLGLALSLFSIFADPREALIGAIAGYLSLWVVFHLFKLLTGKEGMGFGDFKLLALLGAWFGWMYLPQIILISTVLGSVVGIVLIVLKRNEPEQSIPFGPFIAAAGWVAMIWGAELNKFYLNYSGIQ